MSDAEVLDAATAAYARFLAVTDQVGNDGGVNPERLDDVATGATLENSRKVASWLRENGIHGTGATSFSGQRLESRYTTEAGETVATFVVCNDVSGTGATGPDGGDVTPPDRPDRTSFLIEATSSAAHGGEFIIQDGEVWAHDSSSDC